MAAPTYFGHGTGVVVATSITVTKPTGTQTGDYMLVHIQHSTGNLGADGTAPSGWALIGTRQENSSSSHWYYEKLAGASEPASWDWTGYASATLQYGIVVARGADQTTPRHTQHLLQNTAIGGTTVDLSVTTSIADCLLVAFAGQDQTVSTNTWSQASMTERYDESQTSDLTHCGYTETAATATTYARTITASVAQRISGALIAIAPAGGDVTATPAVIACTTALPQSAVNVAAGPAATAATVTLPQATPDAVTLATPTTIAAVAALPAADVNVSAGATVVAATVSVSQPTVNVGAGPAVIPVTVSLPQATPQTGGNATATPAAIATTVTVPQVAINVASGPAVVTTTVTLPQSAVNIAAGPAVVPVTVTLPIAGVNSAAGPVAISAVVTLPQPSVNVMAGPVVVQVVVTLPQASAIDEGAQINGTSNPTVTGLASVATAAALAAVAVVTQGNSSTSAVSDG